MSRSLHLELSFERSSEARRAERARRLAVERRRRLLAVARETALRCGRRDPWRLCTLHDVYRRMAIDGHEPRDLGSAAGSIFRARHWKSTCLRVRHHRPGRRAREIKVWRLLNGRIDGENDRGCGCGGDGASRSRTCSTCEQGKDIAGTAGEGGGLLDRLPDLSILLPDWLRRRRRSRGEPLDPTLRFLLEKTIRGSHNTSIPGKRCQRESRERRRGR